MIPKQDLEMGSEEEVLTGAELLHHLTSVNEQRQAESAERIASYGELQDTLESLLKTSRRSILAPVANGLAYFDAELIHTNDVLVLLGDNWFAERSVAQAKNICERRLQFLRREARQLKEEAAQLESRRDLFRDEVSGPSQAHSRGPNSAGAASAGRLVPSAAGQKAMDAAIRGGGGNDYDAVGDDDIALQFTEDDELTDDELAALEASLDPQRLNDDEYVEQRMLDLMLEKRARRLEALNAAVFGVDDEDAGDKCSTALGPSASSTSPRFASPGDIGSSLPSAVSRAPSTGERFYIGGIPVDVVDSRTSRHEDAGAGHSQQQDDHNPRDSDKPDPTASCKRRVTFADPSNADSSAKSTDDLLQWRRDMNNSAKRSTVLPKSSELVHLAAELRSHHSSSGGRHDEASSVLLEGCDTAARGPLTAQQVAPTATPGVDETHSAIIASVAATSIRPPGSVGPLGEVFERSKSAVHQQTAPSVLDVATTQKPAGRSLFMQRMLGELRSPRDTSADATAKK